MMLDTVHYQGLRLALGAFRTSPVESLYVEAEEPSLYLRREKLALKYAIRLAGNSSNPILGQSSTRTVGIVSNFQET